MDRFTIHVDTVNGHFPRKIIPVTWFTNSCHIKLSSSHVLCFNRSASVELSGLRHCCSSSSFSIFASVQRTHHLIHFSSLNLGPVSHVSSCCVSEFSFSLLSFKKLLFLHDLAWCQPSEQIFFNFFLLDLLVIICFLNRNVFSFFNVSFIVNEVNSNLLHEWESQNTINHWSRLEILSQHLSKKLISIHKRCF